MLARGEALASLHCGGCHALPTPDLLDRPTWQNYVLPRMGYQLGIYPHDSVREALFEAGPGEARVRAANIFPATPQLAADEWTAIQAYYLGQAPDTLPRPDVPAPQPLTQFAVRTPAYRLAPPSTTLVQMAPGRGLYVGDANSQALYFFDQDLQLQRAARTREGAVSLDATPEAWRITVMGSFSPTDAPSGFVMELPTAEQAAPRVLLPNLQRPVHAAYADLDGDGLQDIVVCEFGKWTGALAWWAAQPDSTYQRRMLRPVAGAIRTEIADLNGDGRPDIVALFGQGDEGIFIYYNEGQGRFRETRALTFPASYGSSFFRLYDYDGDGHLDILYCAGDNADYPPVRKPYHGVYVFRNDGQNRFSPHFFYPVPGAYAVQPADFDGDGDTDLAVIAFFPDFDQQPAQGFLYLENEGENNFSPYTFEGVEAGRWLVMDVGDLDGDGDPDIVLGSLTFEVVGQPARVQQWVQGGLPFVVLENQRSAGKPKM